MQRLFLIRHGETDGTAKRKFMGKVDMPLNKKGLRDAGLLADRLKNEKITAFYTSPLKRTLETAKILKQFHNAPLKKQKAFEEIRFGKWEGLTLDEIYKKDKNLCRRWFTDLENFTMPRGESVKAMQDRVIKGWKGIFSHRPKGTVAIVTHGGPIRIFLCYFLNLDLSFFWKVRFDTVSLTILTFSKGSPTLTLLNDTCHK